VIAHSGGMASIRLRDLPPGLQSRFGYNPAAELAADEALQRAGEMAAGTHPQEPSVQAPARQTEFDSKFDELLHRFGQKPEIKSEINLRPRFIELGLGVRDQGYRPSCAVYAVVSALEYQNAEATGQVEWFSEEYLIWATRKTLNQPARPAVSAGGSANPSDDGEDEGFSLTDVVTALRAYGIPTMASMWTNGVRKMADGEEPLPALVEQARNYRRVFVHLVPGHDTAAQIDNIIHALNAGVPVPIGLAWPNNRAILNGILSEQVPMQGAGHAVTLVGYRNSGGAVEGTTFFFRNSFGSSWGQGGYGRVTYSYLRNHLLDAVLLEVQHP
jgi:hypothetical protein